MNIRLSTLVAALALLALAATVGALLSVVLRPQTTVAATNSLPVRQITVVGNGEARGTPDTATVQLGVQSDGSAAREALTANNTKMQALIAKLKELGVADKDMQTSNLNISPRYDEKGRDVVGYTVNNMLTVTIRDVSKAGELLDKVVDAGANNIWGMSFTINDPSALQGQARDKAIADARTRAEAMAKAAGGTIGQVISITENIGSAPPVMYERAMAADQAGGTSAAVQTGEQAINAQVQITFELR